jgi:hypothetical protein
MELDLVQQESTNMNAQVASHLAVCIEGTLVLTLTLEVCATADSILVQRWKGTEIILGIIPIEHARNPVVTSGRDHDPLFPVDVDIEGGRVRLISITVW